MEDCIFCRIAQGRAECAKVWEDEGHMAILDKFPSMRAMTLVIPKKHHGSYAFHMPDEEYGKLMAASKKVAGLLTKALGETRIGMVMEGLAVDHAHIKLYPLHGVGTDFKVVTSPMRAFFDRYPGFIVSSLGPEAKMEDLQSQAEEIRRKM